MILFLTVPGDSHTEAVREKLNRMGIPSRAYCLSEFPTNSLINIDFKEGQSDWTFKTDQGDFNTAELSGIWIRRPASARPARQLKPAVRAYVRNESKELFNSLYDYASHAVWLSRPDKMIAAERKAYQFKLANDIGFRFPHTALGNDPAESKRFIERYQTVILKALDRPFVDLDLNFFEKLKKKIYDFRNRKVLEDYEGLLDYEEVVSYKIRASSMSQRLHQKDALALVDQIPLCPVILQEYIEKKLELRITVVGDKVFPCAIYSQESTNLENKIDWRHDPYANKHEAFTLPPDIERKCVEIVKQLGLQYAALDMILTPEGEYIFLEANANGAWLWIQDLTGMPIAEAIADLLASGKPLN
jgi:glutathione synthase/RimK-type ligase-like ATP-grasp enzyme